MIPDAWLNRLKELGMVANKSGLPTKREAAERAKEDAQLDAARATEAVADFAVVCELPAMPEGTVFDRKNRRDMGAFGRALLTGSGQTNAAFVALVCSLKNNPDNISRQAKDFRGLFRWWYENNKQHMSMREWERLWGRFEKAFDGWAEPETGPHWRARDAVRESGAVEAAGRAKDPAKTLLASIYHALQDIVGRGSDIWLSCDSGSDIMKSLGFDLDRFQVNRLQRQLRREGLIQIQGQHVKGGWFAQRVRTAAAVLTETLARARKAVTLLMTPRQLLTLVRRMKQQGVICAQAVREVAGETLIEVVIQPADLAHAARFLPPDVWRMSA